MVPNAEHIIDMGLPFAGNSTGILTLPQSKEKIPAVILLHGFASNKDEVGNFYCLLAHHMAERQIASFRFTFKNFELSEETLVQSSVTKMVAETEAAYSTVSQLSEINQNQIGILGFSLGGAVAVLAAAQHPSQYKALVTWSCAANLAASFQKMAGTSVFQKTLNENEEAATLDFGWRKIILASEFFKDLLHHQPLEKIKNYPNAFLAIAGSADSLSTYLDQYYQNAPGKPKEKLLIDSADHIFNILEEPNRFAPLVIEKTVSWFSTNLLP